jgi:alanyl-tRNA synthetase
LQIFPTIYEVDLFREEGHVRRKCRSCGRHFWTLDPEGAYCGDQPCVSYAFIGRPATKKSYSLTEAREKFLSFFEHRGHRRVSKYPVVARWRDDVYFVGASIYDFQPWVTEGLMPPPANPLVISQPCVRFTDMDLVGKSGRHLTSFEMMAHHAFNTPERRIYWNDETARYCYEFFTREMGINTEKINFVEDMWTGGGNAGEDLEVVVDGIEVATLVFMHYKTSDSQLIPSPNQTVDTGYGLERIVWLSLGAPTVYDAAFPTVIQKLYTLGGLKPPEKAILAEFFKLRGTLNFEETNLSSLKAQTAEKFGITLEEFERTLNLAGAFYAIADFAKTLVFMLGDGIVPSNVQAGYLARLLIRKILRILANLEMTVSLEEVLRLQLEEIAQDYREYRERAEVIYDMARVEEAKYRETLKRGEVLVRRLVAEEKAKKAARLSGDALLKLYDSHGLTPDYVAQIAEKAGVQVFIPKDFYGQIARLHESAPKVQAEKKWPEKMEEEVKTLPETLPLYYQNSYLREFEARVLAVFNRQYVILDKTAFYPEGGGQLADRGNLRWKGGEVEVVNVQKIGGVILHQVKGNTPPPKTVVRGEIDWDRRVNLMRHHTATHIILGTARKILGEHIWQSGAMKDVDKARLDISHYAGLTAQQVDCLEKLANRAVMDNLKVETAWLPREKAEARYGFKIYQGGVVPGKEIRILKVGNLDAEACAGTHCKTTGEIGLIKILKTERIQDGVERIIFAAGIPALQQVQREASMVRRIAELTESPVEGLEKAVGNLLTAGKESRKEIEKLQGRLAKLTASLLLPKAVDVGKIKAVHFFAPEMTVEEMIKTSSELVKTEPTLVAALASVQNKAARFVVMAGSKAVEAGVDAGKTAAALGLEAEGSGGGKPYLGQGGRSKPELIPHVLEKLESIIRKQLEVRHG